MVAFFPREGRRRRVVVAVALTAGVAAAFQSCCPMKPVKRTRPSGESRSIQTHNPKEEERVCARAQTPFAAAATNGDGPQQHQVINTAAPPTKKPRPRVEDRDVPEAHRGLHDALYGDGEDHQTTPTHDAGHSSSTPRRARLDGKTSLDVGAFVTSQINQAKIAGVYVVRDENATPRYVGVSRDVASAARAHLAKLGPSIASTIRVVEKHAGLARREDLEAMRRKVIAALPSGPPDGNAPERGHLWADTARDAVATRGGLALSSSSDDADSNERTDASSTRKTDDDDDPLGRRADYAAKKRKLLAAMALADDETAVRDDESGALRRAVESADWSAVVGEQTGETASMRPPPSSVATQQKKKTTTTTTIVSPFADKGPPETTSGASRNRSGAETGGASPKKPRPFSKDAVDDVLDDVRPLLQADGGDVRVASVDPATKDVVLKLVGACGACPSATTTMKNGIETALRRAWPDLGRVDRLEDYTNQLNAATADALLDPIRAAFTSLGATATVLHANLLGPGVVELEYSGPENVKYGIELTLLSSPMVTEVRWVLAASSSEDDCGDKSPTTPAAPQKKTEARVPDEARARTRSPVTATVPPPNDAAAAQTTQAMAS